MRFCQTMGPIEHIDVPRAPSGPHRNPLRPVASLCYQESDQRSLEAIVRAGANCANRKTKRMLLAQHPRSHLAPLSPRNPRSKGDIVHKPRGISVNGEM